MTTSALRLGRLDGLRPATSFPLDSDVVRSCLLAESPADVLFERAWVSGLDALPPLLRRGAFPGVVGHVAESVVGTVLCSLGYEVVWHFTGPGRHGVDLIVLTPAGQLVAVEVKGTLRAGARPRLSRRELVQMSAAWVDKADNPGMAEWDLHGDDIYGAVVAVNFAEAIWRTVVTADFISLEPIVRLDQLHDLAWADRPG